MRVPGASPDRLHRRPAYTLVELLTVIAIIMALSTLSFFAFSSARNFADRITSDANNAIAVVNAHSPPGSVLPQMNSGTVNSAPDRPDRVAGKYFVGFQDSVSDAQQEAVRLAALVGGEILYVYSDIVPGFAVRCDDAKINLLRSDAAVKVVEQACYVYACATTPKNIQRVFSNTDKSGNPVSSTRFRLVHNRNTSNQVITGRVNLGGRYAGALSTVGIMDSGVDSSHPDLFVIDSLDFTGTGTQDSDGHGTHVAGVVGARDSLASGGVIGVYPNAPLISLKVLTGGASPISGGDSINVQNALRYVIANSSRFKVCLMAFSTANVDHSKSPLPPFNIDFTMNNLVNLASNRGVLMVAAAGDGSSGPLAVSANEVSPASATGAITIGGLADTDGKIGGDGFSTTSNFGSPLVFVAPAGGAAGGYNINSTIPLASMTAAGLKTPYSTNITSSNGATRAAAGTSFSAAHVAGMLAFVADPTTTVGYVFPGAITTFSTQMTNRSGAINALNRLTHNSAYFNDVVNDGHGRNIPVANFYVNSFLP